MGPKPIALPSLASCAGQFDLYNFHSSNLLDSLEAVVNCPSQSPTILLPGERGIGRSYILDAVAHRLRTRGVDVSALHVDLEGYELGQRVSTFLDYKARKQETTIQVELASSLGLRDSESEWAALLVSLL